MFSKVSKHFRGKLGHFGYYLVIIYQPFTGIENIEKLIVPHLMTLSDIQFQLRASIFFLEISFSLILVKSSKQYNKFENAISETKQYML